MAEQDLQQRVVCDPEIHHGEPTIRGTRVSVEVIVANLASMTIEQIVDAFPQLTPDDVRAAIFYAARASRNTLVA